MRGWVGEKFVAIADAQQMVKNPRVAQVAFGVFHQALGGVAVPGAQVAPQIGAIGQGEPVAKGGLRDAHGAK
jgi:hypothetical protein